MRRGLVAAAGVLVVIGAVAVVLVLTSSSAKRRLPRVAHVAPATVTTTPKPARKPPAPTDTAWPFYGFNLQRTRFFPNATRLDPPFRFGWRFNDGALLEFTPAIYHNTLFFEDYDGMARAVSTVNGHVIWHRKLGTLAAASPGLDLRHKLAFFVLLSNTPGARVGGNGQIVAVSMKSGREVWSHALPSGSESSPLVHGQSVFIGDQGGTVYSFRTYDGHLNWSFAASGSVKGGVAFAHDTIYFGDYGGHVYAVNAADGREDWSASPGGSIYSTPAVAFGRVYTGDNSGSVYASPAVAQIPGLGPTVFIGSYDGNLYALDADTGGLRWSHASGGRIDGSATVLGKVVYFSSLGTKTTTGLNLWTGGSVFSYPDGEFTPVITDGKSVFLIGYSTIYQLLPKHRR